MKTKNRIAGIVALVAAGTISPLAMSSVAHAASVCDAVSGNLVSNCGFESDPGGTYVPTGWTVTGDPTGYTTGASASSGDWGYWLNQARRPDPLVLSQSIATTPGDMYKVSFWATLGDNIHGLDTLDVTFGGVPIYSQISTGLGGNGFLEHSFILQAALASTDLIFSARSHSLGVDLDDISVTHVSATPIPAALALFASGLGALGFAGWRRRRMAAD
jgi:hypothetical protein